MGYCRKPAIEVYETFAIPTTTSKSWLTRSGDRLEVDKCICWDQEMYGIFTIVDVKSLEPGKRILLEQGVNEQPSSVEWIFMAVNNDKTFVSITNSGLSRDGDKAEVLAMDSSSRFELALAGVKQNLEHGIELNLFSDRFPDNLASQPAQTHVTE